MKHLHYIWQISVKPCDVTTLTYDVPLSYNEIIILVSIPDAYFYTKEFGVVMIASLYLVFCPNLALFVSNNT